MDGILQCPTNCLSVTSRLHRRRIRTQTLVFRINSAYMDQVLSPLVLINSFRNTESCHTESNAFRTSMVATCVSWAQSLLLARTSEHIRAAICHMIVGESFGVKRNCSLCWAPHRVCLTNSIRMCPYGLPMMRGLSSSLGL